MKEVTILNEQEIFPIAVDLFESLGHTLMDRYLELNTFQLGVHLVTVDRMAEVNWDYLKHKGPTDVITFDHSEMEISDEEADLYGELFICPEIARTQAMEFSTTWQSEIVRYLAHGILQLIGFNDGTTEEKDTMKLRENHLVEQLAAEFNFQNLDLSQPS